MALMKLSLCVLILMVLESFDYSVGEKACSCYTFEAPEMAWSQAKTACEFNNKSLVVMETVEEWEFIHGVIEKRTAVPYSEWHIGLFQNRTTKKWTWINGKPLTFDKWQSGKPLQGDHYALIAREWPPGSYGLFNSLKGDIRREWICEEQTDECKGICMPHYPVSTTTMAPPKTTTAASRESTILVSTTEKLSHIPDSTTSPAVASNTGKQKGEKGPTTVIIAAALGAVLVIVVVVLVVVVLLRRKRRLGKNPDKPTAYASSQKQPESPYESVQLVDAASLLGAPEFRNESPTKVECEYAVVNKANKKPNKGDLVYAQLADFDDADNDVKTEKPTLYEPTVYADVVPSDVYLKASNASSDPTYANVQTTGV